MGSLAGMHYIWPSLVTRGALLLTPSLLLHFPAEFLQATAALMTSCPFPRMWAQPSPTEPAVPVHVPVPSDAAAWLDADTHELLAREVPGAVRMAVKSKLLAPMQQWLAAYDVAQVRGVAVLLVHLLRYAAVSWRG
jgi:hypothetical protein